MRRDPVLRMLVALPRLRPSAYAYLVGAEGARGRWPDFADTAAEQCEARQAFDKAPHSPVAGMLTVSSFGENYGLTSFF